MTVWQQRWLDRLTAKARRQHKKKPREATMMVRVDNELALSPHVLLPIDGGEPHDQQRAD